MRVLGLAGWSGSGKTTLLEALLPRLRAAGLRVSTVKDAHDGFDMDRPGKDSYRHRQAGAEEVLVASGQRWVLLHEVEGPQPRLADILSRLAPVDLVLVEGFKNSGYAKIEVYRPALGKPALWPGRSDIIAVASGRPLPGCDRPVLPLDDPDAISGWIAELLPRLPTGTDPDCRPADAAVKPPPAPRPDVPGAAVTGPSCVEHASVPPSPPARIAQP
jgi:molybdopterin-guanine dinucleotide biosynthesis protein B